MTLRNYEVPRPTEAQALRAFTAMKTDAIGGDQDATYALAIYAAIAQIATRVDRLVAHLEASKTIKAGL